MFYRDDPHLAFLSTVSSDDLEPLVRVLTTTPEGHKRSDEYLTRSPLYAEHTPRHQVYWQLIAGELQRQGGHSLSNQFRAGAGVSYDALVRKVCRALALQVSTHASVKDIEGCIVSALSDRILAHTSGDERKRLGQALGIDVESLTAFSQQVARDPHASFLMMEYVAAVVSIRKNVLEPRKKDWQDRWWHDGLVNMLEPISNWIWIDNQRKSNLSELLPHAIAQVAYLRRKYVVQHA